MLGAFFCSYYFAKKYIQGLLWKRKFRCLAALCVSYAFLKNFSRINRMNRVVSSIVLREDGASIAITHHFPFSLTKTIVPIEDLNFPREDELERMLRSDNFNFESRCYPVKENDYVHNVFIDGTVCDSDVLRAVS